MITNERQYRITKSQLSKLEKALNEFDMAEVIERLGSSVIAQAEVDALKSEESILIAQIKEYELLRSGQTTQLKASNLNELPSILIRARIARGLTQRELAHIVGLKEQQIQRYEADEYATASLRRLEQVAVALKLNFSEVAELSVEDKSRKATSLKELDWSQFPIKEMYRRQWFEGFSGSLATALNEGEQLIYNLSQGSKPVLALHRKHIRANSVLDPYTLLAWQYRILSLSAKVKLGHSYEEGVINPQWISELIKMSQNPDGPLLAVTHLAEAGIPLIIEPSLDCMRLDGAALMSNKGPVIGMTLRYDRLDNFWFVLIHELFHVIKHLRRQRLDGIFDDLDSDTSDKFEREADVSAGEALISEEEWSNSLVRYIRSPELVKEMANKLQISPAIIAGRIRYEAKNYVILNDLVGQGKVRKLFPEAGFGK